MMTFFDAMAEVEKEDAEVPNHLRDASRDAEGVGHGDRYIYPHAYRDHWAAQQYLPSALRGKTFYTPSAVGYEGRIREEVLRKREIQAAVILGDGDTASGGEFLSWSASSKGREGWFKRMESGRSALLLADRDRIMGQTTVVRHYRVLIPSAGDGLLLWESLRKTPEGLTAGLVETQAARDALLRFAAALDEAEKPQIAVYPALAFPSPREADKFFSAGVFDPIFARENWRRGFAGEAGQVFREYAPGAWTRLAPAGELSLLQSPPLLGERLSRVILEECGAPPELSEKLKSAEEHFFVPNAGTAGPSRWLTWDAEVLQRSFEEAGFTVTVTPVEQQEERLLSKRDISAWFDKDRSSWGTSVCESLGDGDFNRIREALTERAARGPLIWKWKSFLLLGKKL
jgi:putative ATPase